MPLLQLMGNTVRTWKQYYDLNRFVRSGQEALDDLHTWRKNVVDSVVMHTDADAAEEIDDEDEDGDPFFECQDGLISGDE